MAETRAQSNSSGRSKVRVYLITYRRPKLLPRAIESLLAQTFTDWVCTIQNNDPADSNPAALVASYGDPRLELQTAGRPIGPVEAFNRAHVPASEPYQTLLEDDNWWEPTFLASMVALLEAHPDIELAFANMRVWVEQQDGSWENSGRTVWRLPSDSSPRVFAWPQLVQFNNIVYSNGSMLLRSRVAGRLQTPTYITRDLFEQTRERMMDFPLMLHPAPLVNFAVTRQTLRSTDFVSWGQTQALLGAAFLKHVPIDNTARAALWAHAREQKPPATNPLFYAALVQPDWAFLRHARVADWLLFLRGCIRRPFGAWRTLRVKRHLAPVWTWLSDCCAARTAEATARGFKVLTANSLVDKQNPDTRAY